MWVVRVLLERHHFNFMYWKTDYSTLIKIWSFLSYTFYMYIKLTNLNFLIHAYMFAFHHFHIYKHNILLYVWFYVIYLHFQIFYHRDNTWTYYTTQTWALAVYQHLPLTFQKGARLFPAMTAERGVPRSRSHTPVLPEGLEEAWGVWDVKLNFRLPPYLEDHPS